MFSTSLRFALGASLLVVELEDAKSETTLQGYDTVGCSRLQLNLVIADALQCMNFDSFYGAP